MSKLAECLAEGSDVFEVEEKECFIARKKDFDDEYNKIFEIEKRLRRTCIEMYYPQIFHRQKVGLFLFLSDYKK
ncbi:hypothetical protein GMAR_ORF203 [Golden Marseillevirus]|uniref:hypothetical protein n=1 Tax=Golden Marseillevirus TaxID=1720526 RepID=UPI000877AED9|nr:hypothetical protein GMAR_ORF203 [Golden Marseillevirus]ALX27577.1 hypothetical protein GMAR_ORF203 [Golden Marseillevirus]